MDTVSAELTAHWLEGGGEWLLVFLIMMCGAAAQAVIGMGLNLLSIPLLLMIDPVYAPGPVFVVSCLLCFSALWRVPAKVDFRELGPALAGLAAGTVVAAGIISAVDGARFTQLLALFVLIGVGLALTGWSAPLSRRTLLIAGGGAGVLGTIAGVHGPPIALLYQGQAAERVRGALLMFIGIGNGLAFATLALLGQFGWPHAQATLVLLPGVCAGLLLAPLVASLLPAALLRILILAISGISGGLLVMRG
ncbi:MAG: sulfite exporter TauE/SafE family protein [Pseudomonadota bacterium]